MGKFGEILSGAIYRFRNRKRASDKYFGVMALSDDGEKHSMTSNLYVASGTDRHFFMDRTL